MNEFVQEELGKDNISITTMKIHLDIPEEEFT